MITRKSLISFGSTGNKKRGGMKELDSQTKKIILGFQKNEITEHIIYKVLSGLEKDAPNSAVLKKISDEELTHYKIWHSYTGRDVRPNNLKRWFYVAVSLIFGITFAIKLMEEGEKGAQASYENISKAIPEASDIQNQENEHEKNLIGMIDEKRLVYLGSIVLGLNDALIEFTGALSGFTFAMGNARIIAMAGLIMGISASLSMGASEYFSTKTEAEHKNPVSAAIYTSVIYIVTVLALVIPYFLFSSPFIDMIIMLLVAVLLILVFTFYFSVVREISFKEHFNEMLLVSMGVAAISFIIGVIVKKTMNIEM